MRGIRDAAVLGRGARDHRHQHPVVGRQRGGDRARLPQPAAEAAALGHLLGRDRRRRAADRPHVLRGELLQLPYLKLVGAALLLWIGIKLIAEEDGGEHDVEASDRLVAAVKTVIVADLVMSLDNVIGVAGAAKGSLLLLVFGLVVSIPLVVVGSQLIMKLIERFPSLVVAGGGLLGYIAGEIAIEDAAVEAVDRTRTRRGSTMRRPSRASPSSSRRHVAAASHRAPRLLTDGVRRSPGAA